MSQPTGRRTVWHVSLGLLVVVAVAGVVVLAFVWGEPTSGTTVTLCLVGDPGGAAIDDVILLDTDHGYDRPLGIEDMTYDPGVVRIAWDPTTPPERIDAFVARMRSEPMFSSASIGNAACS